VDEPLGSAVDEAAVELAAASGQDAPAQRSASSTRQAEMDDSAEVDPITDAPHAVWFVRPPSGGQYGPASGDIMRTWIAEGRVTDDSLVWREGWPDWKKAGPLFPGLRAASGESSAEDLPDIVTQTTQRSTTELYRRKKSTKTALTVVVLLLMACVILFATLVYVIKYVN
jgi:hypothetical protein